MQPTWAQNHTDFELEVFGHLAAVGERCSPVWKEVVLQDNPRNNPMAVRYRGCLHRSLRITETLFLQGAAEVSTFAGSGVEYNNNTDIWEGFFYNWSAGGIPEIIGERGLKERCEKEGGLGS